MNCQEALSLLYDYIDREVSEIDAQQVKEHLDNCEDCLKHYNLETAVNDLLRAKVADCNPTPRVEDLKSRVLEQLDEIDNQESGGSGSNTIRLFSLGLVAAASLIIVVGAAFFGAELIRHQAVYYPLEDAHFSVAQSTAVTADKTSWETVRHELQAALHYDIKENVAGYSLAGGFIDTIKDIPASHFIYRDNGSTVSVFVFPADKFEIPEDVLDTRVSGQSGTEFFDHHCRGCRLVFHRAGDAVIVTASSDREVELLDFVPGHASL